MPLPSAEELEAQAREVERAAAARAAQIQKEAAVRAAQLRRDAADVRKLERRLGVPPGTAAEAQRQLESLLPLSVQSDTPLDTMSSGLVTAAPDRGRPFEATHPLPAKLKQQRKPDGTKMKTAELAAQLSRVLRRPVARTTVRSWYLPRGHRDARAIPEAAVKFFEAAPWNIPRSAWKNGITDTD